MTPDMSLFVVVPEQHARSCTGCDFYAELKAAKPFETCARASECLPQGVILIKKEPTMAHAAKVDESKKESAFLSARSKAWDAYAESRRLSNHPMPSFVRREGFDEGYTQGFAAGKQAERTMIGLTVCEGRARCTDPATSQEAAKVVQAGKLADLVLVSLRDAGPGTAHEVAERIGHPLNAVSPRFVTLKRRGLIHVSGGSKVGRAVRSIYSYGGAPL